MPLDESAMARPAQSPPRPTVVFLDQNMWIDLARAVLSPQDHPRDREVLKLLCAKAKDGAARFPLTVANLYETHKVIDPELRAAIAYTQTALSSAEVFRGRRRRLEVEISRVLSDIYGLPWLEPEPDWVFSRLHFESQAELDDPRFGSLISDDYLAYVRKSPSAALFDYLAGIDETVRREAVAKFEASSEAQRLKIEARRAEHQGESLSMRRKIYSVLLVLDDQDTMIAVADKLGLPWRCFEDQNGATMRRIIKETPTFIIEREIVLKLEALNRPSHVNDLRDMQNFTTVLPYADLMVTEKAFSNLARQAGLATHFGARLETNLESLAKFL
jgi:hypothetical protein